MKILVIRLSSLGDVLLTSPVVRCLKQQMAGVELWFLTKPGCAPLLSENPYIDHVVELTPDLSETVAKLCDVGFDYVIDLHNNHRSRAVRRALGKLRIENGKLKIFVYKKENIHKFLYVITKHDFMSGRHVVDRYFKAVEPLAVYNDDKGLECFLPDDEKLQIGQLRPQEPYVAIACGAQHYTKQIPPEQIARLCQHIGHPVVLLGDKNDRTRLTAATSMWPDNVRNLCGETSLMQSAALVRDAMAVVTPDSVMMHFAAAFHRPTIAVWGATAPSFGFSCYKSPHVDCVAERLRCHPCSRMGSEKCRHQHFRCMSGHDWEKIALLADNPERVEN